MPRSASGGGATPMLPKNGRSGMTIPGANAAVIVFAIERNDPRAVRALRRSSRGRTRCSRCSRRGSRDRSTGSSLRARRPARRLRRTPGPVRMCPPGPASAARRLLDDRLERRLDLIRRHAGALQAGRRVRQQRVDVDDVARRDPQHRRRRRRRTTRRRWSTASPRADGSGCGSRRHTKDDAGNGRGRHEHSAHGVYLKRSSNDFLALDWLFGDDADLVSRSTVVRGSKSGALVARVLRRDAGRHRLLALERGARYRSARTARSCGDRTGSVGTGRSRSRRSRR